MGSIWRISAWKIATFLVICASIMLRKYTGLLHTPLPTRSPVFTCARLKHMKDSLAFESRIAVHDLEILTSVVTGASDKTQVPLGGPRLWTAPDSGLLRSIIHDFRPELQPYEDFYRTVHHDPEISGMEKQTAALVAEHLSRLGFKVHEGIGGHGVAGTFENGDGNVILMRAELDALPIFEETKVAYKSTKRMIDRYGNERPVMHACGHDMNMATLLSSAALLKAAAEKWSGTLVVVFQPDEEEMGGARAMVNGGLYSLVPKPDVMLAQHVVPSAAGTVAIRSGPVLVAADSANVRITGGPCQSINPQQCVDPIPLAMKIILQLQDAVRDEVGPDEDATVACWGFHAGIPGNDYVAFVDFLLDIKTIKPEIRSRVQAVIEKQIRDGCKAAGTPKDPTIHFNVRAPLTQNDPSHTDTISQAFSAYFAEKLVEMQFTRSTEDFSTLGEGDVPYVYWNYGGSQSIEEPVAINHSPFFAPSINPTLLTGTDAMALAALTYLLGEREGSGGSAQL